MTIDDIRSAVAHFVPTRDEHSEPLVQHVAATGVNVLHAAWELYGRSIGVPCQCTPVCGTAGRRGHVENSRSGPRHGGDIRLALQSPRTKDIIMSAMSAKKETPKPLKFVAFAAARAGLSGVVDEAQNTTIVITRAGKPAAIVMGIEGLTIEEVYERFPNFGK